MYNGTFFKNFRIFNEIFTILYKNRRQSVHLYNRGGNKYRHPEGVKLPKNPLNFSINSEGVTRLNPILIVKQLLAIDLLSQAVSPMLAEVFVP